MKQIPITDIAGVRVGHAADAAGGSGCTVILCAGGATAGADVRGGGPATRETDLLRSEKMIQLIHAVVLSGGSAYGLDAAGGVMRYLEQRGCGFDVGCGVVPIVCGASLFDLQVGDKSCRPDAAMGYVACCNATGEPAEGNVGAGTGATVGKLCGPSRMMKSGLGIYAVQAGAVQCAAIVAVNALGDVVDPASGRIIAGLLSADGSALANSTAAMQSLLETPPHNAFTANTTLCCLVTNAKLTKVQCNKLASVAHNGLALAIRPVHTSADGDAVFALATGAAECNADALGTLATEVVAQAIVRAVQQARPAYGLKAAADMR